MSRSTLLRPALVAALLAAAALPAVGQQALDLERPAYQRKSLVPLAQPLWSQLKEPQRQVLAPFADQWNALPLVEKRAWVTLADRFPRLSEHEKQIAEERIAEWAQLTPEQRRTARQNYRLAKSLPREERAAQWEQYQTLTDEQREILQRNGNTSNTAARHAGARTALAKEAAQPLGDPTAVQVGKQRIVPTSGR